MKQPNEPFSEESWYGGSYEAAIVVGRRDEQNSEFKLLQAVKRIWSHPSLRAVALDDLSSWDETNAVEPGSQLISPTSRIYGIWENQFFGSLPFVTMTVLEEVSYGEEPVRNWLYAGVPLGGIAESDGYPFGDADHSRAARSWREPLEDDLAALVLYLAEEVSIETSSIGFEIFDEAMLCPRFIVPERRYSGYVVRQGAGYMAFRTNEW